MTTLKKPIPLRIIFILNAMMMILPFIFYYVFITNNISIEGLDPMWMVYTGAAYIVSFIVLVVLILNKSLMGVRAMFVANVLIALPVGAYIGIGVAVISMLLSFNNLVKGYFAG